MTKKNYTLKEIAQLADVSRGTVDRVLHKRGRVSEEAQKKVEKILKDIDYKPNLFAQSLKTHKNYTICALIPEDSEGEYWQQCAKGVQKAEEELRQFGISISYVRYVSTLKEFKTKFIEAIEQSPDAFLIVPVFPETFKDLYHKAEELKKPIALINSEVEGLEPVTFLGQAYKKSGKIAAQLMSYLTSPKEDEQLLVMHLGIKSGHSSHLTEKEDGFRNFFATHHPNTTIKTISSASVEDFVDTDFDLSHVAGMYVTTSKIHQLEGILKKHPHIQAIGYDLTAKNTACLKKGTVKVLLNQNPELQGHQGITSLSELLLYSKSIPKRNLLRVDIVIAENLDEFS
ncbi:substrate-binding domain-containing protein [Cytophaga sp. FL35]|uniref:substrate-binding domain-containing protein n=1 Tax=Cytophaga sp. FL35 TaxID=1904456 RepID=UPI001653BF8B|nr:substrate-binding domain-containing protein [Cytophaga sp. FL35]MBC6999769.1 substrate-binding domain-containing protein [Cytophaga sp. FL35]